MSSKIQICSNAGLLLGQQPINDLAEVSDKATLAFNLYDYVRDSVIRANNWSCCIKRVILSPLTTSPPFGFSYQFSIPGDCLRVLSVTWDESAIDHRVENNSGASVILANTSSLSLRYLFRNVDESSYDAGLVDVLTAAMAFHICYPTTSNAGMTDRMQQTYLQKLRTHRSVDSMQGTTTAIMDSPLLNAHSIGLPN